MGIDSAYTSTKQIPRTFKKFQDYFGNIESNLDFGGGKYELATNWLEQQGAKNYVYDPFNRSKDHNESVMDHVIEQGVDCITCLNVLNVIQDKNERIGVLSMIRCVAEDCKRVRAYPTIFIQVYEGNKTGEPSRTTAQMNRRATDYYDEIRYLFNEEDWLMFRYGNIYEVSHV